MPSDDENLPRAPFTGDLSDGSATGVPLDTNAVSTLAGEVVRRLAARRTRAPEPDPERVTRFCAALTTVGGDRAAARLAAEIARAEGFDALCASLLAPAARTLGEMWDHDRLGFTDVMNAAARIIALVRKHAPRRPPNVVGRNVVFASTPGEAHTLGVIMAAEQCRAAGWDVDLFTGFDHETLVTRISALDPQLVGLSISGEGNLLALVRSLLAIRIAVPNTAILVVGPDAPWLATARPTLGADAVVTSHDAAIEALGYLTRRTSGQGVRSSAGTTRT